MIDVEIKLTSSFHKKLSPSSYEKIGESVLKGSSRKTHEYVQTEGVGVAGGKTPSGGAPVWKGNPKMTTYYPGYLKDNHYIDNSKKGISNIISKAYYAPYVINGHVVGMYKKNQRVLGKRRKGTTHVPPNPYHKRSVDKAIREGVVKEEFRTALKEQGLK